MRRIRDRQPALHLAEPFHLRTRSGYATSESSLRKPSPPSGRWMTRRRLPLVFFTEGNGTLKFSQNCRLFRLTSFEQVSNAWQTTGDIFGTARCLWNTSDRVTNVYLRTIFQLNDRFDPAGSTAATSVPGIRTSLPFASTSFTVGRSSLPEARSLNPEPQMLDRPVSSSV